MIVPGRRKTTPWVPYSGRSPFGGELIQAVAYTLWSRPEPLTVTVPPAMFTG